jgi:RNA-directed DNA polymerase
LTHRPPTCTSRGASPDLTTRAANRLGRPISTPCKNRKPTSPSRIGEPPASIADKAVTRFKDRVRELTRRHRGVSLEKMIADLNPFVRGWAGYFGFSQWRELPSLDGWIRRRLRCVAWVQWKTRGQRYRELRRLKVPERSASAAIFSPKGPWRLSFSEALHRAFTKARFRRLGLISMEKLASA